MSDYAANLLKIQDLLSMGFISQEEFDDRKAALGGDVGDGAVASPSPPADSLRDSGFRQFDVGHGSPATISPDPYSFPQPTANYNDPHNYMGDNNSTDSYNSPYATNSPSYDSGYDMNSTPTYTSPTLEAYDITPTDSNGYSQGVPQSGRDALMKSYGSDSVGDYHSPSKPTDGRSALLRSYGSDSRDDFVPDEVSRDLRTSYGFVGHEILPESVEEGKESVSAPAAAIVTEEKEKTTVYKVYGEKPLGIVLYHLSRRRTFQSDLIEGGKKLRELWPLYGTSFFTLENIYDADDVYGKPDGVVPDGHYYVRERSTSLVGSWGAEIVGDMTSCPAIDLMSLVASTYTDPSLVHGGVHVINHHQRKYISYPVGIEVAKVKKECRMTAADIFVYEGEKYVAYTKSTLDRGVYQIREAKPGPYQVYGRKVIGSATTNTISNISELPWEALFSSVPISNMDSNTMIAVRDSGTIHYFNSVVSADDIKKRLAARGAMLREFKVAADNKFVDSVKPGQQLIIQRAKRAYLGHEKPMEHDDHSALDRYTPPRIPFDFVPEKPDGYNEYTRTYKSSKTEEQIKEALNRTYNQKKTRKMMEGVHFVMRVRVLQFLNDSSGSLSDRLRDHVCVVSGKPLDGESDILCRDQTDEQLLSLQQALKENDRWEAFLEDRGEKEVEVVTEKTDHGEEKFQYLSRAELEEGLSSAKGKKMSSALKKLAMQFVEDLSNTPSSTFSYPSW